MEIDARTRRVDLVKDGRVFGIFSPVFVVGAQLDALEQRGVIVLRFQFAFERVAGQRHRGDFVVQGRVDGGQVLTVPMQVEGPLARRRPELAAEPAAAHRRTLRLHAGRGVHRLVRGGLVERLGV